MLRERFHRSHTRQQALDADATGEVDGDHFAASVLFAFQDDALAIMGVPDALPALILEWLRDRCALL